MAKLCSLGRGRLSDLIETHWPRSRDSTVQAYRNSLAIEVAGLKQGKNMLIQLQKSQVYKHMCTHINIFCTWIETAHPAYRQASWVVPGGTVCTCTPIAATKARRGHTANQKSNAHSCKNHPTFILHIVSYRNTYKVCRAWLRSCSNWRRARDARRSTWVLKPCGSFVTCMLTCCAEIQNGRQRDRKKRKLCIPEVEQTSRADQRFATNWFLSHHNLIEKAIVWICTNEQAFQINDWCHSNNWSPMEYCLPFGLAPSTILGVETPCCVALTENPLGTNPATP